MLNRNQSPPNSNKKVSAVKIKIIPKSDALKTIYLKKDKKLTIRPGTYTMEESKTNLKDKNIKSSQRHFSKESFTVRATTSPTCNLKPTQKKVATSKPNSMPQTSSQQQSMNNDQQNHTKYSMLKPIKLSNREKLIRSAEILQRKRTIDSKYTNLRRNHDRKPETAPQTTSRQMHYRSVQMMQNQMAFSPQQYQQQMYMWQQNASAAAAYRSPWYSEMRQVRYADLRHRISEQTNMAKYKKKLETNVSPNSANEDNNIDSELSIDENNTEHTSDVENVEKNKKTSTTDIKLIKSTSGDMFYECAETLSRLQSAQSKTKNHVIKEGRTPKKPVDNITSKSKVNTFWKFEEVSLQKKNDLAEQIQLLTDAVKKASVIMSSKSRTTCSERTKVKKIPTSIKSSQHSIVCEESKNQKPNFQYSVSKNRSSVNLKISNNFLESYPKIVFKKRMTDSGTGMETSTDQRKFNGLSNFQINKEASSSTTNLAEDYISFDYNCKSDNDFDKEPERNEKIPLENDPNGLRIKSLMERMENLLRTPPVNARTHKIQQILRPQNLSKGFTQNCCNENFVDGQPTSVKTVANNHPEYFYSQFRPIHVPINIPTTQITLNPFCDQENLPKNFSELPAIELDSVCDGGGDCSTKNSTQNPNTNCSRKYSLNNRKFKNRKMFRHSKYSKLLSKNVHRKFSEEHGKNEAIIKHEVLAQMGKSANIINVEDKEKIGKIYNKGKVRKNSRKETVLKTELEKKMEETVGIEKVSKKEKFPRLEKIAKIKTIDEDKNSHIVKLKKISLSIFYILLFTVMFVSLIGPTFRCLG